MKGPAEVVPIGPVMWLEEAMAHDQGAHCAALAGTVDADFCIVGGGYAGLWTAVELRERAPDAKVVLIEREACGFGASGRNGGWATSWYKELAGLASRYGDAEALRLAARSREAIDRIESFSAEHGIDAGFRRGGALKVATGEDQLKAWWPAFEACRRLGVGDLLEHLSADEVERRTGLTHSIGGWDQTDGASVHPGHLVRGLRRVALEMGVRIYEGTPMLNIERGAAPTVLTPAGRVCCRRVILTLGAWGGALRELRRAIVPVGTNVIATEPLGDRIEQLAWRGPGVLGDTRMLVHYAQITERGQIVFGRGGGPIGPAGRVTAGHFGDRRSVSTLIADFKRWFPQLSGVRFTHAWGGPVDRSPGHFPFTGTLGDHAEILYGLGFSGNGVAPSAYIGSVLARQALEVRDADTESPIAAGPPKYLPPEPLRLGGGLLVRGLVEASEWAEEKRAPHVPRALLERLSAAHVPAAIEPRTARR